MEIDLGLDWEKVQIDGVKYRWRYRNNHKQWQKWVVSKESKYMGHWENCLAPVEEI